MLEKWLIRCNFSAAGCYSSPEVPSSTNDVRRTSRDSELVDTDSAPDAVASLRWPIIRFKSSLYLNRGPIRSATVRCCVSRLPLAAITHPASVAPSFKVAFLDNSTPADYIRLLCPSVPALIFDRGFVAQQFLQFAETITSRSQAMAR